MTGLEYMRTVCPTTRVGKDPLREDVMDAFEDGIAEGWKQCKEKQWKPTEKQIAKDVAEKFARVIRGNLSIVDERIQNEIERVYREVTGEKMYGGFID